MKRWTLAPLPFAATLTTTSKTGRAVSTSRGVTRRARVPDSVADEWPFPSTAALRGRSLRWRASSASCSAAVPAGGTASTGRPTTGPGRRAAIRPGAGRSPCGGPGKHAGLARAGRSALATAFPRGGGTASPGRRIAGYLGADSGCRRALARRRDSLPARRRSGAMAAIPCRRKKRRTLPGRPEHGADGSVAVPWERIECDVVLSTGYVERLAGSSDKPPEHPPARVRALPRPATRGNDAHDPVGLEVDRFVRLAEGSPDVLRPGRRQCAERGRRDRRLAAASGERMAADLGQHLRHRHPGGSTCALRIRGRPAQRRRPGRGPRCRCSPTRTENSSPRGSLRGNTWCGSTRCSGTMPTRRC